MHAPGLKSAQECASPTRPLPEGSRFALALQTKLCIESGSAYDVDADVDFVSPPRGRLPSLDGLLGISPRRAFVVPFAGSYVPFRSDNLAYFLTLTYQQERPVGRIVSHGT